MINNKWDTILKDEFSKKYFQEMFNRVLNEYKKETIFPSEENIFNAFKHTDYDNVKVVIIGQDPYHGEGQAEGLSFSVGENVKRPPSLRNIYKELESDLNIVRESNSLIDWSDQGVLLLNAILTVKKDTPLSHKDYGWELFTDEVIKKIDSKKDPVVFILWGNFARSKKELIRNNIHLILESAHPSPFSASRGFFGNQHFSKTNSFLIKNNKEGIRW